MKYGARRAPIWQTSKKTPETRQPRVLHSRTMRNSWISVMQLALGTEARARRIRRGWRMVEKRRLSAAMAKRPGTSRRATRSGKFNTKYRAFSESEIHSLAALERGSRGAMRNPWAKTPSSHPRRRARVLHTYDTYVQSVASYIRACNPGGENRSIAGRIEK